MNCNVCGFGAFAVFSKYKQCCKCGTIYVDDKIIAELVTIDAVEKYGYGWIERVKNEKSMS